jgi:hypothetical protein
MMGNILGILSAYNITKLVINKITLQKCEGIIVCII